MTESTFSPAMVDLAWEAANNANQAFDRMRDAGKILDQLTRVDHLGLAGVSIAEEVYSTLESQHADAQSDFDILTRMAAPVMLAADSPFATPTDAAPEVGAESWRAPQRIVLGGNGVENISRTDYDDLVRDLGRRGIMATRFGEAKDATIHGAEEQLFNFGAAARTYEEVLAFAERQGYSQSLASRAWNAVYRAGTILDVPDLATYEALVAASPREGLTSLRVGNPHRDQPGGYCIDINTLHRTVAELLQHKSEIGGLGSGGIRNLGVTGISFLAAYINHALPDIEQPLTVTHPPRRRPTIPAATEVNLEPPKLLDVVRVKGEDREFVTHLVVKRFLLSKGYTAQQLTALPALFRSLAHALDPSIDYPDYNRQPAGEDLVFVGTYKTTGAAYPTETWGIAPQRFITLIKEVESSPALRDRLTAYTDFSRSLVLGYITALRELTGHQDEGRFLGR